MKKPYADLYLLPLPKKNLARYKNAATRMAKLMRKHGALQYREFMAEDLHPKWGRSFAKAAKPKRGELVVAAVIDFKSRAHRDQVMSKAFHDPVMTKMMKEPPVSDMKKMYYGGFKTIVDF